jgi:protein gp37
MATRFAGNPKLSDERRAAYAGGPLVLWEDELAAPLKLRKPAVIGVQFMGDLFHERVPFEWIDRTFEIMANEDGPDHTYVILTKRPERINPYLKWVSEKEGVEFYGFGKSFVIGVSVENQETADERIPLLLQVTAAKRIVSYEPGLGAVNFDPFIGNECTHPETAYWEYDTNATICSECDEQEYLDAIICGPETSQGARPFDLNWARQARDQCAAAGVAFFYKGGELDGKRHEEMP